MLLALQDLSGKSMDLYDALKLQFAKNAKLSAGTPMAISGQVIVKPKIDTDPTEGAAFLKAAADAKPAGNSDAATITIKAEGAGVKVDGADAKPAEKKADAKPAEKKADKKADDKKADAKPADKKADDKKADDAAKPAADKK